MRRIKLLKQQLVLRRHVAWMVMMMTMPQGEPLRTGMHDGLLC